MKDTFRVARWIISAAYLALLGCSSDPYTFITYSQRKAAPAGNFDPRQDSRPTDALALNYANSVEEIFRARSTGSRYTREASDTALAGLSAFAGAAETLSISVSTLSGMGLAGVGIIELRKIFDAKGRSNAYFEAAERVHGAIKDFRAHNLNDVSETSLSPNGWTLANIVQANIDIVDKILNGHLPSPEALAQASEPMTAAGATPQRAGTIPINNIPTNSISVPSAEVNAARAARVAAFREEVRPPRTGAPAPAPVEIQPGEPTEEEIRVTVTKSLDKQNRDPNAAAYEQILTAQGLDPTKLPGKSMATKIIEAYKHNPDKRKAIAQAVSALPE